MRLRHLIAHPLGGGRAAIKVLSSGQLIESHSLTSFLFGLLAFKTIERLSKCVSVREKERESYFRFNRASLTWPTGAQVSPKFSWERELNARKCSGGSKAGAKEHAISARRRQFIKIN